MPEPEHPGKEQFEVGDEVEHCWYGHAEVEGFEDGLVQIGFEVPSSVTFNVKPGDLQPDDGEVNSEKEPDYDWPDRYLDRMEPWYVDFRPDPSFIREDRRYWDHKRGAKGELGRLSLGVQFIGKDGFGEHFHSLRVEPEQILPDTYGGISAGQTSAGDYVAFSETAIEHSPDHISDAMAVAADPLVAAAALRAWYDRQFGKNGNMTLRSDRWDSQRRREESEEWKDDGVTFEIVQQPDVAQSCANCESTIPAGGTVWKATIAPGRAKEGRCTVCMRGLANSAEEDGYTLNGPDPRSHDHNIGGDSDD